MSGENIKRFFGHSWGGIITRIVFGLILFFAVTFIRAVTWPVADYWAYGWPFYFSESWGPCPSDSVCNSSNILALFADIILWYFILCLVVFAVGKLRKGKNIVV
jgi:hypothetical protein